MGVFSTHVQVNPSERDHGQEIELIVDAGATLTKLPTEILRDFHIEPQFSVPAVASENREVMRPVGQAWINIDGQAGLCWRSADKANPSRWGHVAGNSGIHDRSY